MAASMTRLKAMPTIRRADIRIDLLPFWVHGRAARYFELQQHQPIEWLPRSQAEFFESSGIADGFADGVRRAPIPGSSSGAIPDKQRRQAAASHERCWADSLPTRDGLPTNPRHRPSRPPDIRHSTTQWPADFPARVESNRTGNDGKANATTAAQRRRLERRR